MPNEKYLPTKDNLLKFLDFASSKGLMKPGTAGAYKKACNTILGILDEGESADLSALNLETVFTRHSNLAATTITPVTLKSYQARTRAAVKNFLDYAKKPAEWKSTIKQREPKTLKDKENKGTSREGAEAEPRTGESPGSSPSSPSVHIDIQIHIPAQATPEQIDQIFASMKRHLYAT